jgi:hypothetical protein
MFALRAISSRRSLDKVFALARPPLSPPLRDDAAFVLAGEASSVAFRMILKANTFTSICVPQCIDVSFLYFQATVIQRLRVVERKWLPFLSPLVTSFPDLMHSIQYSTKMTILLDTYPIAQA